MPDDHAKLPPFDGLIDAAASQASSRGADWLIALNGRARRRYAASGWPHAKTESWKYTNLNALASATFGLAPDVVAAVPTDRVLPIDGPRVVLVNGILHPDLSDLDGLGEGITLRCLSALDAADQSVVGDILEETTSTDGLPLAALSTAVIADALVLDIADGVVAEKPVHVISIGAGANIGFAPRLLIRAGKDSVAEVIESHVGSDGESGAVYFSNGVTQVTLARGARLGHYKLQNEATGAFHIALAAVEVAEGATYDSFVLSMGARLARHEIRGRIGGAHVEYRVNGAYMATGSQHIDNTTFIEHAAPGSRSREVYKGVLAGASRGVFQGKILVQPIAQKTDGYQMNRAMLLSDKAEINAKPELEIYADDVRCSHGATVGELDEEQLFYLRARGLDRAAARRLLVAAYIDDAIDEIQSEAVRDAMKQRAAGWLSETLERDGK